MEQNLFHILLNIIEKKVKKKLYFSLWFINSFNFFRCNHFNIPMNNASSVSSKKLCIFICGLVCVAGAGAMFFIVVWRKNVSLSIFHFSSSRLVHTYDDDVRCEWWKHALFIVYVAQIGTQRGSYTIFKFNLKLCLFSTSDNIIRYSVWLLPYFSQNDLHTIHIK